MLLSDTMELTTRDISALQERLTNFILDRPYMETTWCVNYHVWLSIISNSLNLASLYPSYYYQHIVYCQKYSCMWTYCMDLTNISACCVMQLLWSILINNYCQYRIQYHSVTVSVLYWTTVLVLSTPPHHTTMRLWGKPHHHRTVPLPGGRSYHQQCRSNLWCGGITKSSPPSRLVNRHLVHLHQGQIILQGDGGNTIQTDG
jgi:hypothetical protein